MIAKSVAVQSIKSTGRSVSHETKEMQAAIAVLRMFEALGNVLLLQEFVLLDGLVDSDNVLPDNTASTTVEMTTIVRIEW
jgi:hypothetical protein